MGQERKEIWPIPSLSELNTELMKIEGCLFRSSQWLWLSLPVRVFNECHSAWGCGERATPRALAAVPLCEVAE